MATINQTALIKVMYKAIVSMRSSLFTLISINGPTQTFPKNSIQFAFFSKCSLLQTPDNAINQILKSNCSHGKVGIIFITITYDAHGVPVSPFCTPLNCLIGAIHQLHKLRVPN
mmetsp:Transcript_28066/g.58464  ORF Transcript_28066/g.58464 Transcript_28066/m.58464 type:complete len:114 (+) Transcript_28066:1425-1766(+)